MTVTSSTWSELTLQNVGLPSTKTLDPTEFPEEVFELYSVPSYSAGIPDLLLGSEIKSNKQIVQPDDVLLCKIVPHINRVWRVKSRGPYRQIASGEWIVIRSSKNDPDYLRYALTEPGFREQFMQTVSGVGGSLMRARPKAVAQISVKIPKHDVQRRVVAKLDNLFARSRTAREELTRIPRLTERYKQAILLSVFTRAVDAALERTSLDNLATGIRNGLSRKPAQSPPGIPILRISAVRSGKVDLADHRFYVPEPNEKTESFFLADGDLLFTRYNGNAHFVAVCGVVRDLNGALLYPDKLIRVRLNTSVVSPEFIELLMLSQPVRQMLSQHIKTAAGQHGISGKDLKSIVLPVPPLDTQREIVSWAAASINRMTAKLQEVKKATILLDRLDQATLSKAFRGELLNGANDPINSP